MDSDFMPEAEAAPAVSESNVPVITEDQLLPDTVLQTVQRRRLEILLGKEDTDGKTLELMVGLAKTAIDQKRIQSDDQNAEADREVGHSLTRALSKIGVNPFLVPAGEVIEGNFEKVPLPAIEAVPDEMSTQMSELEYDEKDFE